MKPTAPPEALVREYLDVLRPHRWVLRAVGVVPAVEVAASGEGRSTTVSTRWSFV